MPKSESKTLTLSSEFDEIEKLEYFINDLQQWLGFDDDDYAKIMLTLSEAATNAIIHGNNEDPAKKVHISAWVQSKTLLIRVQDEGPGINPSSLPDPLKEQNLLKESGRGVFLIKQYADKVSFSKNPAVLTMEFLLSD